MGHFNLVCSRICLPKKSQTCYVPIAIRDVKIKTSVVILMIEKAEITLWQAGLWDFPSLEVVPCIFLHRYGDVVCTSILLKWWKFLFCWQLHLIRTYLAEVSMRYSSILHKMNEARSWGTSIYASWACTLSIPFMMWAGGYGVHEMSQECCSHCCDWNASSLLSSICRLLPLWLTP